MHFPTGMTALAALLLTSTLVLASPTSSNNYGKHSSNAAPFQFDKTFVVEAYPDQVVSGQGSAAKPAPGEAGAMGIYLFGVNVKENVICYNITLTNVSGPFSSPAKTATHIHEAAKGANGPPRLAFPNPEGDKRRRVSLGCLKGPFTTGIMANGVDTGAGFHVRQLVDGPKGFFADAHTVGFPAGAVRGQFA